MASFVSILHLTQASTVVKVQKYMKMCFVYTKLPVHTSQWERERHTSAADAEITVCKIFIWFMSKAILSNKIWNSKNTLFRIKTVPDMIFTCIFFTCHFCLNGELFTSQRIVKLFY